MPICATAGVASGGAATVAGVRKKASMSAFKPKIPLTLPQPILAQPMTKGPLPGLALFDHNILLKQNRSYRNCFRKTRLDDGPEITLRLRLIRNESSVPANQPFHP
jgi:hypothetical protein